ncbi:MAG TPA: signal peptidase II [Solirubrobacteraceae bacterium]
MRVGVGCVRAAAVALVVFWLDQMTKTAVNNSIVPGQRQPFLPGVQLVNLHNHGYLLGVGFVGRELRVIMGVSAFALATAVLVLSLLSYRRRGAPPRWARGLSVHRSIWLPIGMMLGSALGNMGELISQGSATDFINITGSRLAFNLADIAGLLGGLTLIAIIKPIRLEVSVQRRKPELPPPDAL